MKVTKWTLAVIGAVVIVAVLGIGMWQLGWFIKAKNVQKENQILTNSDGRQIGYVTQIDQDVRDILANGVPAGQVKFITGNVCDTYGRLTATYKAQLNRSVQQFVSENC